MRKRWLVDLSDEERADVEAPNRRGKTPTRKVAHARALLLASDGLTDEQVAMATRRSRSVVERTRKRFVPNGLEIWDKPPPRKRAMLDERDRELELIADAEARAWPGK
jgi:transposase